MKRDCVAPNLNSSTAVYCGRCQAAGNSNLKFKTKISQAPLICCDSCNSELEAGGVHMYCGKSLCEDCIVDIKIRPKRKTHWQYLRSIKSDYLRLGRPRP